MKKCACGWFECYNDDTVRKIKLFLKSVSLKSNKPCSPAVPFCLKAVWIELVVRKFVIKFVVNHFICQCFIRTPLAAIYLDTSDSMDAWMGNGS